VQFPEIMVAAPAIDEFHLMRHVDAADSQYGKKQAKPFQMTQTLRLHVHLPIAAKANEIARRQQRADAVGLAVNNGIQYSLRQGPPEKCFPKLGSDNATASGAAVTNESSPRVITGFIQLYEGKSDASLPTRRLVYRAARQESFLVHLGLVPCTRASKRFRACVVTKC
jgi:hypothetical protein